VGDAEAAASAGQASDTAVSSTKSGTQTRVRSESLLPSLGWWAKNLATPTGIGKCGSQASLRESAAMRVTGLSDTMSTLRNLEDVLQQRQEASFSNEPVNADPAGRVGGGEWEELSVGVNGFNHGGVEWMINGGDGVVICCGKITGGPSFCTENGDV
jgi:hypothetical protein